MQLPNYLFACTLTFFACGVSAQTISLSPTTLSPGSPVLISVEIANASSVDGSLLDQPLHFFHPAGKLQTWMALAGIDVEAKVEPVTVRVTTHLSDGTTHELTRKIVLTPAHYRTTTISVAPKFVKPPAEDEKEIADEQALKMRLFTEANEAANEAATKQSPPLWQGNFQVPVKSPPTDSFGTRRVVLSNSDKTEKIETVHKGMDFRAPAGTVVRAANSGTVLLAQHLYYEGNCVILDHGLGLYTFYMHFSRIDVKPGQKIATGERLGLSGATGRVTGPHLHWAVRYQNASLDPARLLKLALPATGSK